MLLYSQFNATCPTGLAAGFDTDALEALDVPANADMPTARVRAAAPVQIRDALIALPPGVTRR
jgi:hypothetical protein